VFLNNKLECFSLAWYICGYAFKASLTNKCLLASISNRLPINQFATHVIQNLEISPVFLTIKLEGAFVITLVYYIWAGSEPTLVLLANILAYHSKAKITRKKFYDIAPRHTVASKRCDYIEIMRSIMWGNFCRCKLLFFCWSETPSKHLHSIACGW